MGASRDLMNQKAQAYLEHYEQCKSYAYEHPEFQKHFKMAEELCDFIVNEYNAGNLDGKDLFDCSIELEDLFNMHRDEGKKQKATQALERMKDDIKEYLADKDA